MVRSPCVDKNGMKKGAWSEEEDNKLRAYVLRYGHWNWRQLPRFAGLKRCGKSCRLRWMNYLKPTVKRGNFTKDEDEMILKLHNELGNKWSVIAAKLPGRSDNEIKNYWHSRLKKRHQMKQDPEKTESTEGINQTTDQYGPSDHQSSSETLSQEAKIREDNNQSASSSEVLSSSLSSNLFEETLECFWDDMFLASYSPSGLGSEGGFMSSNYSLMVEDDEFTLPYSLFGDDDSIFFNNFMQ